jgi:S1-C subfamily serine protease
VGDRIVAVDGVNVDTDAELGDAVARHQPDGNVRLTISRVGAEEIIEAHCVDGQPLVKTQRKLLESMAAGHWSDCVRYSAKWEQALGLSPAPPNPARARAACAEALATVEKRRSGPPEAALVYEAQRRSIRQATLVPNRLEEVRGDVLNAIEGLRAEGFPSLADDLQRTLNTAAGSATAASGHAGSSAVASTIAAANSQTTPIPVVGDMAEGVVSTGTCFAVAPDGLVLSAHHVVKGAGRVNVRVGDGISYPATIEAMSPQNDLVLLKVPVATPEFLSLAQPQSVRLGQRVFTVGFPAPAGPGTEPRFAEGSVSALSGPQEDAGLIEISVPVEPGNSGGPLVNEVGEVEGVVTSSSAIRPSPGPETSPPNVNWAVRSELAMTIVPQGRVSARPTTRDDVPALVRRAVCYVEASR